MLGPQELLLESHFSGGLSRRAINLYRFDSWCAALCLRLLLLKLSGIQNQLFQPWKVVFGTSTLLPLERPGLG